MSGRSAHTTIEFQREMKVDASRMKIYNIKRPERLHHLVRGILLEKDIDFLRKFTFLENYKFLSIIMRVSKRKTKIRKFNY